MKQISKKFFAFCLALTLMVSGTGTVFAAGANTKVTTIESKIQQEIQKEKEIARANIYVQLEQQDALIMLEIYEDIIYPEIEYSVRAKYQQNSSIQKAAATTSYTAPNGGVVTYLAPLGTGVSKPTEVAVTCLNQLQTGKLAIRMAAGSTNMAAILNDILGSIPKLKWIGWPFSTLFTMQTLSNDYAFRQIEAANDHAKIINTYSREYGTSASVLTGWTERYKITVPSNATSITFTKF